MSSLLPILAASTPASNLLRPQVTVEIAFNADYNTAASARVWTNVTEYVRIVDGIGITHGRGDELSQADANTLRLTLKNSDGRFTPGLSTSPYYPNVKIGRPIRVSVMTASGHTSVRYVGYIDEWPLEWPLVVDTFATSAISASSRMARLGLSAELKSIVEEEILLDDPVAYYTLGEASGATTIGDTSGNNAPALVQVGSGTAVLLGNSIGPTTDGLTAATFAGGKRLAATGMSIPVSAATGYWFECWFTTSGVGSQMYLTTAFDADNHGLNLLVNSSDQLAFSSFWSPTISSAATVTDGQLHHALVTLSSSGHTLYLDGVSVGSNATAAADMTILAISAGGRFLEPQTSLTGSLSHVAYGPGALSATRIAAHYNAGRTGFAAETPAARLTRYAAFAGVPTAEMSFETGDTPNLAHVDTTGVTALETMRRVEATEEGVLFDARDGTLTFHDRSHRYGAASSFTLDASAGQVEASYAPKLDRSALRNDVTATSTDGTINARAVNQNSIDTYGVARSSLEVATTNADEPYRHASWIVGQYGEPAVRAPQLGVEIAHLSQSLQASLLAATVGTRFTVSGLPSQSDATSKQFYVEGYTETIGPETHRIEFNVSPAAPWNVWILGDPTYGVLGSTTRLAL